MAFRPEAPARAASAATADQPAVDATAASVGAAPDAMRAGTAGAGFERGATLARTGDPTARTEQPARGSRKTPRSSAATLSHLRARAHRVKAPRPAGPALDWPARGRFDRPYRTSKARKSLTLVKVGPGTTRSPSGAKKLYASLRS